jgi:thioredoxin reductase (NADPH)
VETFYDLIIIGAGPAGMSAAIYGGRAKLKTLVINKGEIGGQARTTREIVNYPGYKHTSGQNLMNDFRTHAESLGVEFLKDQVISAELSLEEKVITTKKHGSYTAKAIVIACGSEPRLLGIPGEKEFKGMGVAYCATCDAEFFTDEHVVVIGSGDQAIEEGMFITKYARKVTIVVLHDEGVLDCNKLSAAKAFDNEKVEFIWNSTIEEVLGEENVTGVRLKNIKTGQSQVVGCEGVFFFVGMIPATGFMANTDLERDKHGYIPTNDQMETNIEGIYAAGDTRVKYLRQVSTAIGDGATAAIAAERYITELDDFVKNVVEEDGRIILLFFNAYDTNSIEYSAFLEGVNKECGCLYHIVRIDTATKKILARKYGVNDVPLAFIAEHGILIKQIDTTRDLELLRQQMITD